MIISIDGEKAFDKSTISIHDLKKTLNDVRLEGIYFNKIKAIKKPTLTSCISSKVRNKMGMSTLTTII